MPQQRRARHVRGLVHDPERSGVGVVDVDRLVGGRDEVDEAAVEPDALAAAELDRVRDLAAESGVRAARRIDDRSSTPPCSRRRDTRSPAGRRRDPDRRSGVKRYSPPSSTSSLRYTCWWLASTHAASCWKSPIAECGTAGVAPVTSHSQTRPRGTSSHESHAPHGVGTARAVRARVRSRMRYAAVTPAVRRRSGSPDAPPRPDPTISELTARIQPPSPVVNVAAPSGYDREAVARAGDDLRRSARSRREREARREHDAVGVRAAAATRTGRSVRAWPAAPRTPSRQKVGPNDTAAAVVRPDWINRRRVSMRHVYRAVYQRAKERSSGVTGRAGSPPPECRHSGDGPTTATGAPGAPPDRLR